TSRAKTPIVSPSGRAWSSGRENSWSVSTNPCTSCVTGALRTFVVGFIRGVQFHAMTSTGIFHRRPRTEAERADRATLKAIQRQNRSDSRRNRKSQLLLTLAIGATIVGASLWAVGSFVGLGLVAVGVPTTVAVAWWALRNWDY